MALSVHSPHLFFFRYSTTEGASWYAHNFTDYPMNVFGVVNEPGKTSMISRYLVKCPDSVSFIGIAVKFLNLPATLYTRNRDLHVDIFLFLS